MRGRVSGPWTAVWAAAVGLAACRATPDWGQAVPSEVPQDEGTGGSLSSGSAASGGSNAAEPPARGGAAMAAAGGAAGAAAGVAPAAGGAGEDEGAAGAWGSAEPNPELACDGQAVSWEELQSGQVRLGAMLTLEATVTSQKFLVSHSKAGSCLWGVFVGADPVASKPRGLLLVSYGERAENGEACPSGTDGLPDDSVPGQELSVVGQYSPYASSSCEGVAPSPQVRVEAACPAVVSGKRAPIVPVTLPHAEADLIARGADAALLRQYAGGLVRLESVSGVRAEDGEGVVAPYGVLRFSETRLEVHNDVEYGALLGGGQPLSFPYPSSFAAVTGLVHLDYCSWTLAPRDRCRDFQPPSTNCLH